MSRQPTEAIQPLGPLEESMQRQAPLVPSKLVFCAVFKVRRVHGDGRSERLFPLLLVLRVATESAATEGLGWRAS